MIELQEIYCHDCGLYVHCRVVENGRITDIRWDNRNRSMQTYYVSSSTITTSSAGVFYTSGTTASTATGNYLIAQSWLNSTSLT